MNENLSPLWSKLKVISLLIASIIIPITVTIIGNSYTSALKQNEVGARYIGLAIGILSEPPSEDNMAIRNWAIETIDYYSVLPLKKSVINQFRIYQINEWQKINKEEGERLREEYEKVKTPVAKIR